MALRTTSKTALIVYAHQEPKSFNAALKDAAVNSLEKAGYSVEVSDLYAQGFDPRATVDDFTGTLSNPNHLRYNEEAKNAYKTSTMCAQTKAEVEKVRRADVIVFQFPVYWLSVPAILKGWFDKVLVAGFAFDFPNHLYDNGLLKGKKAILSVTTGSTEIMNSDRGVSGDINISLWPIQYGTLRFCGFDVMRPHICFCPGYTPDDRRKEILEEWKNRLQDLHTETPIDFVSVNNFDPEKWFIMKEDCLEEALKSDTALSVGHHLGKKLPSVK
ncbi:ribosyldihydronicotinamide dehydrogenase [quinone]-like [Ylistrum balloti]|uniref:ribosyldihydronicotinamide dehydrogenase [quinone]-like n=1 Tax=Ylistrum balloti TaxID=509963 RepID=UPI002905A86F|nr:ribosyldihydronicotinamide dehydrogenase [quinone]-like [Ylistrum balloti]